MLRLRRNRPPLSKVPLTPQASLTNIIVGIFGLFFFILMALFSVKHGTTGTTLLFAFIAILSAIALVDSARKRSVIMQGREVLVPDFTKSVDTVHFRRAFFTMGVISLSLMYCVCAFLLILLPSVQILPGFVKVIFWAMVVFGFGITFGLYCYAASKRLLLWSNLRQGDNAQGEAESFSLPPLTVRGLILPTLSLFYLLAWIGTTIGSDPSFWGGFSLVHRLARGFVIGLTAGSVFALLYVGLVAVLWVWSNHISRAARREADVSAEQVWPPPVAVPQEQEKEDAH